MLLMQIFKRLVLLGAALLPALATSFLALTSDPLRVFPLYAFHEVAVSVAVLLSLFVAYVAHQSYKKAQYSFLHFVALAYLGFAIVYAPHGALTHLADHNVTLFLIFGPASRLTVSTYLLLGLLSLHPRLR